MAPDGSNSVPVGSEEPGGKTPPSPVTLTWKDLSVYATNRTRPLLAKQGGVIKGGFTAIMGPSGSGKTTLLNTLACRLDANTRVEGEYRINGSPYSNSELKKMSAYVMQDDVLNVALTVEETLRYTAKLRLPPTLDKKERERRVEDVLQQMGIAHCRTTVVGSPLVKGISGGERKRLCTAMELLTQPQLLFLDEPTSGLDSVTALSLCTALKNVADTGKCTVICTIHQPQTKIFDLFDHLLLLRKGEIVYHGPAKDVLEQFDKQGFPCPPNTNPADHVLDVITIPQNGSTGSLDENFRVAQKGQVIDIAHHGNHGIDLSKKSIPYHKQFTILFRRCLKEQFRKPWLIVTQLAQNIITAVLIGTVFLEIGHSQSSVTRRQPVLFFCVINQGMFGALQTINSFPAERILTLRERAAGTYYVSAYFLAKIAAETLTQLPSPVIFSCIVYYIVGFQVAADKFFIFMAFMILCSTAATSLALMISALCRTTELSVTVLPMALEVCRLFGGFFLSPKDLPKYFVWLDILSYVKYTYVGIAQNELQGLELYCKPNELKNGQCPSLRGEDKMNELGLDYIPIYACALILILYICICRFIAYLGIRYIKW
eukprot:TRINITY_DN1751_c0_g1_i1.p1 TRINITY_DN1751_c0_g1~~TRINITY_DN1751_c0_g1_i1.p1  ORF type:complete len:601 (+),score=90.96 TRINITY_DN1751_c0_g1_i1:314-2116(+)